MRLFGGKGRGGLGMLLALILALGPVWPAEAATVTGKDKGGSLIPLGQGDSEKKGDEVLLSDSLKGWNWTNTQELGERLKKEAAPNGEKAITSLSASGLESLRIEASLAGIVVEPVEGSRITLDYLGVAQPSSYTVTTQVNGSQLLVRVAGASGQRYVSTQEGNRVNVVRIGVPAGLALNLDVEDKTSCIFLDSPGGNVKAATISGIIRVNGSLLSKDYTMESANGTVAVEGTDISGSVTMKAANGTVAVKGTSISAAVALQTANGTARLEGQTVTGRSLLNTANGTISVTAGTLKNADFTAANGTINANVGTVGEKVSAQVANGSMYVTLTRKPTNLAFELDRAFNSSVILPAGWKDGYRVGDGKPVLSLKVQNGLLKLDVE